MFTTIIMYILHIFYSQEKNCALTVAVALGTNIDMSLATSRITYYFYSHAVLKL